jgi:hypothetical protein
MRCMYGLAKHGIGKMPDASLLKSFDVKSRGTGLSVCFSLIAQM